MSPKRGDRAAAPPTGGEYDIRFATSDAADGWEHLARQAPGNLRQAFDAIRSSPRARDNPGRHHRLKGTLGTATFKALPVNETGATSHPPCLRPSHRHHPRAESGPVLPPDQARRRARPPARLRRPPSPRATATQPARVTPEERSLKLTDLVKAGIVRPGSTLTGDYRGGRRTAEVLPDGKVGFGGDELSLSAAGAAAKVDIAGPGLPETARQTDGWDFWKAPDPTNGQLVSLKNLRRDLARSLPRRPSP